MFSGECQAAWFLKNITYADNNASCANFLEELDRISQELEQILQAGWLKCKDPFGSGDQCPVGQPIQV